MSEKTDTQDRRDRAPTTVSGLNPDELRNQQRGVAAQIEALQKPRASAPIAPEQQLDPVLGFGLARKIRQRQLAAAVETDAPASSSMELDPILGITARRERLATTRKPSRAPRPIYDSADEVLGPAAALAHAWDPDRDPPK